MRWTSDWAGDHEARTRRRSPPSPLKRQCAVRRAIGILLGALLLAGLASFVARNVLQLARIEGTTMAPTLGDQDHIVVNRLVYRLRSPRRGEIVMLLYPINPEKLFVERVIAMAAIGTGIAVIAEVPRKYLLGTVAFRWWPL